MTGPRPGVLVVVFVLLLMLLVATIAIARIDLGGANLPIAALIAAAKTLLIVLYFMHVRYSPRLIWLVAGGGFVWLGILIGLSLGDYLTRGWTTFSS